MVTGAGQGASPVLTHNQHAPAHPPPHTNKRWPSRGRSGGNCTLLSPPHARETNSIKSGSCPHSQSVAFKRGYPSSNSGSVPPARPHNLPSPPSQREVCITLPHVQRGADTLVEQLSPTPFLAPTSSPAHPQPPTGNTQIYCPNTHVQRGTNTLAKQLRLQEGLGAPPSSNPTPQKPRCF